MSVFPDKFLWGVSASGFQFEMGDRYRRFIDCNTDWWVWVRDPTNIAKGIVSGDLPEDGVDYIEYYKVDHEIASKMGLNTYRIGIEWSRVFPYPTKFIEVDVERNGLGLISDVRVDEDTLQKLDSIANKEAVNMYRSIIYDLRSRGFKVIVNLHHFTLPLWLHNPIVARNTMLRKGPLGIVSEEFIVEYAKYAAYIAWKLGDLVDMWSTYNEPLVPVELGYLYGETGFPPGVRNENAALKALKNYILAHSIAYRLIKKWDRVKADRDSSEPALVGVIHNIIPPYPYTSSEEAVKASETYNRLHNTLILDAWVYGKVDPLLFDEATSISSLKNTLDWIGVNYYTRDVVEGFYKTKKIPLVKRVPGLGHLCIPRSTSLDGRPCSDFGWEVYPEGITKAVEIVSQYRLPVLITENGIADRRDELRPSFIIDHISALEEAYNTGIKVQGYLHWALTDNYEWAQGFRMKFGLVYVDLETKKRVPRRSAYIYSEIVKNNGVPKKYRNKIINN